MSADPSTKPILGGSAVPRGTAIALVVLVLTPPAAWLASLGGSYLIDDFVCTAAASAGTTLPSAGVLTAVIVLNALLFIVTVAAGFIAYRIGRRGRGEHPAIAFLGISTLPSALVFGYGIVLIAISGIVLGGCT